MYGTSLMRSIPRVCSRGRLSNASSICSTAPFGSFPSYWFSMRIATIIGSYKEMNSYLESVTLEGR